MAAQNHSTILIVDFGSQWTQLIARRVREANVFCEIVPFQAAEALFRTPETEGCHPFGRTFLGRRKGAPRGPRSSPPACRCSASAMDRWRWRPSSAARWKAGIIASSAAPRSISSRPSALFEGVWRKGERHTVWMSHGDRVTKLPPGFSQAAVSPNSPYAVLTDEKRRYFGLMFHPEVVHTPDGAKLISNFVHKIAGCAGDWTMAAFREEAIGKIRAQAGGGRVLCGLSGGVDSAVAAVLIHEAMGDRLTCVFVDHGLMREGEAKEVVSSFAGITTSRSCMWTRPTCSSRRSPASPTPNRNARPSARLFIEVFEKEACMRRAAPEFLAQGTLYPDVIESVSATGGPRVTIKSITMSADFPSACA